MPKRDPRISQYIATRATKLHGYIRKSMKLIDNPGTSKPIPTTKA